jgi:beta-phosphoglucomutase family hydrolase
MNKDGTRAVIWDMDGVIADTGPYHFKSWQYAFKMQGIIFHAADFQRLFGQRNDTIIRNMMKRNVTQTEVDMIAEIKEAYFRQIIQKNLKPFPGVKRLLEILKENTIQAAIASSAPMENIRLILGGLGIADYFQAIVYGREVTEGKPSPQIFLRAAQKLGAEPPNCIVIEDAVAGVTAAIKAGMHCIGVTNTHAAEKLAEADLVVDSLEKVSLQELKKLFNS